MSSVDDARGSAGRIVVEPIDPRDAAVAARMHTILLLAHAQEAALIEGRHVEPLLRTVADVQAGRGQVLGAFKLDVLAGCVIVEPDDEPDAPGQWRVSTLVVHPAHQRRGVARALMQQVLRLAGGSAVTVATGTSNVPALALYHGLGFVTYRQGSLGPLALPMVKLRHVPAR
jgi:ribosomal protein S18 acetylase RimI-like enzyme